MGSIAHRLGFADGTIRPLWRSAAAALENILTPPAGAHLWYDDRDVAFLQEDIKDRAEARKEDAITIETLWRAGYDPYSIIEYVTSGDLHQLKHTGVQSVQTQERNAREGSA